jgi:hypothetical protein
VEIMQRDIQALERRLADTEMLLQQIVGGIQDQLRHDSDAVPAWLIPLLRPPVKPLIDAGSGQTIGWVIYSSISQLPKKVVSTHFIKADTLFPNCECLCYMDYLQDSIN